MTLAIPLSGLLWTFTAFAEVTTFSPAPGVRIVVASPNFPEKADRGRKETVRVVLFT
jgi:hypothetical protein